MLESLRDREMIHQSKLREHDRRERTENNIKAKKKNCEQDHDDDDELDMIMM